MNPEIKQQWIEALRSGKYEQGKSALRNNDDTFCCLGVLCDLAVNAGVLESPIIGPDDTVWQYGGHTGTLPEEVIDWADLQGSQGDNPIIRRRKTLSSYNDEGTPFAVIADLIEEYL